MSGIDDRVFDLYDEYCHSDMGRRAFLRRVAALGIVGGVSMAQALLPDYARAAQVNFNDPRIRADFEVFPSPGGNAPDMRAYVVRPSSGGPFPAVLVVHENRGRNPYVEDVARRLALAGFLAVAPDALWAVGGYPGNDDEGRVLQRALDRGRILVDMVNSAGHARVHPASTGKLGVVGFCFGGFVSNHLAVELGGDLQAAVPFYGQPPDLDRVDRIRASLLLQFAEDDPRVNDNRAAYEEALTKAGVSFEAHRYKGTKHGFHNDSTPRFDEKAAALAWKRTLAHFQATLG